jgi:rRNA-processing protein FCF1
MMLEQNRDIDEEVSDLIRGPAQVSSLDLVERELRHIGRTHSSKTGGLANAALELLKRRKYAIFESKFETSDTDAGIVSFSLAEKRSVAVATVDRKLRASLGKLGVSVISPKRQRGLMMTIGTRPSST